MRALICSLFVMMLTTGCVSVSLTTTPSSTSSSYPVEVAPAQLAGLPEVLEDYQGDWPSYWKGSVKGTRAIAEEEISLWLVELLDPPVLQAPYCVSEGATWEYQVIQGGVLDLGPGVIVGAHYLTDSEDCTTTLDGHYFAVDPLLVNAFADVLDSAAVVLTCAGRSSANCPDLGSDAETLARIADRNPFDPLSVDAIGQTGARVTYAINYADSTDIFNLDFSRTVSGWSLAETDLVSVARTR
ncbi:MAG: hypothetical protein AAGJ52_02160 [Pseudomonadota bacterium]